MTAATMMFDDKAARRRFRRLDLGFEEPNLPPAAVDARDSRHGY